MRENTRRQRHHEAKKKGFIISFGDIILPVVGIMAIGLLVIAGKLFFSKGVSETGGTIRQLPEIGSRQADAAPLTSTEDALSVLGTESAVFDSSPETQQLQAPHSQQLDLLAIPYGGESVQTSSSPFAANGNVTVTTTPLASQGKVKPAQTQARSVQQQLSSGVKSKGRTVSVKPQQSTSKTAAKPSQSTQKSAAVKTAQSPAVKAASQWRVQVGAYGSRDAANEIVSKLSKSGHTATVFASGRFFKVWVHAGATKQSAESVMTRLKRGGFPDSYLVPPTLKN